MRFDEVELAPAVFPVEDEKAEAAVAAPSPAFTAASRTKRSLALLTDLSLFAALVLALSPLLPPSPGWIPIAALAGFAVLVSFYYFVAAWLLWGKTIGGTIFDVRVIAIGATAMPFKRAAQRWAGMYLSLLTGGIGFALAALPSRMSLPDRVSGTCCVS